MKILGICASPRIEGNSDILLDACLKGAQEKGALIDKIYLGSLNLSPCSENEYFKADDRGYSPVKDDMERVFNSVETSQIIVISSPIFFGSISAQLKIMIDRFQSVWVAKNIMKKNVFNEHKKAAFLCVSAANRGDFFDNANFIVRHFFATISAECNDNLFVPMVEEKGDVSTNRDVIKKAQKIGEKLVFDYVYDQQQGGV